MWMLAIKLISYYDETETPDASVNLTQKINNITLVVDGPALSIVKYCAAVVFSI